jgi:RNA-directed DNA polymerase
VDRMGEKQLKLPLMVTEKGEARRVSKGPELGTATRRSESPASTEQLMEEVCERENLKKALKRVRENKGAPGIDGMTVEQLPKY